MPQSVKYLKANNYFPGLLLISSVYTVAARVLIARFLISLPLTSNSACRILLRVCAPFYVYAFTIAC